MAIIDVRYADVPSLRVLLMVIAFIHLEIRRIRSQPDHLRSSSISPSRRIVKSHRTTVMRESVLRGSSAAWPRHKFSSYGYKDARVCLGKLQPGRGEEDGSLSCIPEYPRLQRPVFYPSWALVSSAVSSSSLSSLAEGGGGTRSIPPRVIARYEFHVALARKTRNEGDDEDVLRVEAKKLARGRLIRFYNPAAGRASSLARL